MVAWYEGSRLQGLILRHTGSTDSLDRWFGDCARPANDSTLDRFRKALQMMRLQADSEVLRGSIARPVYSHDLIFSWS